MKAKDILKKFRNELTANRQQYKSIIFSGCSIEANGVSICNLNDYLDCPPRRGASYQVWSDVHKTHELYHSLDDAVDKFLELKNRSR